ncbi:hypothetical protein [Glaesserella parasuis]|uniref:Primosomal replication protein PriB/PriC domain protein n=1 Tax=Glaesserella parasuis TaxID=738 RepID=A0AA42EFY3_GLAPU|nr:hypothetical protein [Glaesserella parasuis]MDD2167382.1 hypothetical protein [Glaesserella parasuis]MDG6236053.1 hypothetical protein [Glaesserella parasuis]MDG6346745.1 hypothetical protein [Glaesserella parasuis]MDG6449046.1 hypothetical protein [Glaesserella parasuis]MDG6475211.1 hypothetical protein [Glaesserella parasuis]
MRLDQIQQMIDKYVEAELAVLEGKSITFNGRNVTRENLAEIRKGREYWEERLSKVQRQQAHQNASGRFKLVRF